MLIAYTVRYSINVRLDAVVLATSGSSVGLAVTTGAFYAESYFYVSGLHGRFFCDFADS